MFGANFMDTVITKLYMLPAILLGLSLHECMHAFAAFKLGDPTARNLGRVTLDPTKHLDPIGFLMFILFGFGWAKPVPVNSRNFKNFRRDDVIVSLAGPLSNLVLSFVMLGIHYAVFFVFGFNEIVYNILFFLVIINIYLFVFNLVPIPPLDGYHIFKSAFIKVFPANFFMQYEKMGFFILIIAISAGGLSGVLHSVAMWFLNIFNSFYFLFIPASAFL